MEPRDKVTLAQFSAEELAQELARRQNVVLELAEQYHELTDRADALRQQIVQRIRTVGLHGVTQNEVARTMGVANSALSRWIQGTRRGY